MNLKNLIFVLLLFIMQSCQSQSINNPPMATKDVTIEDESTHSPTSRKKVSEQLSEPKSVSTILSDNPAEKNVSTSTAPSLKPLKTLKDKDSINHHPVKEKK